MRNLIHVTVKSLGRGSCLGAGSTAPSIGRALKIAGDGKLERRVRIIFAIDPESFFISESQTAVGNSAFGGALG